MSVVNGDSDDGAAVAVAMHQYRTATQQNESPALQMENERLKRELVELRRKISKMTEESSDYQNVRVQLPMVPSLPKRTKSTSARPNSSSNNNSVVLELPEIIGNNNNNSRSTKDHQSVSTADDRETVEPPIDIESHQSGGGLHHRSPRAYLKPATSIISTISTSKTPRTEPMSDDEISSNGFDDEIDDPLAEARGLIGGNSKQTREVDGIMLNRAVESTASTEHETDPSHRQLSFCQHLADRAGWLVGLLVFQSLSSFILARNESLLQKHTVIVHFLTMLVGAGGNAGNQASVGVVRGIAIGSVSRANAKRVLGREFCMGIALSLILGFAGLLRAKVFAVPWWETIAITTSLYLIVVISVILGASLPLGMEAVGIDPAHSSTTIQVIMDITGVVITVHVSSFLLDSDFHDWVENKFGG